MLGAPSRVYAWSKVQAVSLTVTRFELRARRKRHKIEVMTFNSHQRLLTKTVIFSCRNIRCPLQHCMVMDEGEMQMTKCRCGCGGGGADRIYRKSCQMRTLARSCPSWHGSRICRDNGVSGGAGAGAGGTRPLWYSALLLGIPEEHCKSERAACISQGRVGPARSRCGEGCHSSFGIGELTFVLNLRFLM